MRINRRDRRRCGIDDPSNVAEALAVPPASLSGNPERVRPISQVGVGNTARAALRDAVSTATVGRDGRIGVRKREVADFLLRRVVWRREQRGHQEETAWKAPNLANHIVCPCRR